MTRYKNLDAKVAQVVENWKRCDAVYLAAKQAKKLRKQSRAKFLKGIRGTFIAVIIVFGFAKR